MGLSTAVRAMCVHAAAPAQRIGRPSCSAAPAGSMRRFGLKSAFLKDARPRERLQKKTRAFRAQRKRHPASAREDGAQAPGQKKNAPEMAAAACSVPSQRRKQVGSSRDFDPPPFVRRLLRRKFGTCSRDGKCVCAVSPRRYRRVPRD